jgi:AcrR family transcriptional regulator
MSLYDTFTSNAALVEAYIHRRHEEWLDLYRARITDAATAQERVLAVFDAYIDHATAAYDPGSRGCGLLNAAAELPVDRPGRMTVRRHKEQVERLLVERLSSMTGTAAAKRMAEHFSCLGWATARAGLDGESTRLHDARAFAAHMLAAS